MIFNSLAFAVFLPAVFLIYWAVPHKYRWIWLLAASYYFYMSFNPKYMVLLLFTTGVTYSCALLMERASDRRLKRFWFLSGTGLMLAALFYFKYLNFAGNALADILRAISLPVGEMTAKIVLPVGISFYFFKSIGYMADVYMGKTKAERHAGYYAAYISFFPDLVSGPIDRAQLLLPQMKEEKSFCYDSAVYGLRLMLLGFVKKLVIADALTKYVDLVFDNVGAYGGLTLVVASVLFTFQIYCDFSGYSDIAVGTARLLGIELMKNFDCPYFARSIKEFWRRWHISLSTWFRDYVYIPLGGSRVKAWRAGLNVMITFLVSGLWHGAAFTYVIWGGIHGGLQVVENAVKRAVGKKDESVRDGSVQTAVRGEGSLGEGGRLRAVLLTLLTFALVNLAWVFFRANSLGDALYFVAHMFGGDWSVAGALGSLGMSAFNVLKIGGFLFLLMVYDYFSLKRDLLKEMSRLKMPVRWAIYLFFVLLVVVLKIHNGTSQQFIYFQF